MPEEGLVYGRHMRSMEATNSDFHLHDSYEIYYLIEGEVDYFIEQSRYHLQAGHLILFDNKAVHKCINATDGPIERIKVHFNPHLARQISTPDTQLLACFTGVGEQSNIIRLNEEEQKLFLALATKTLQVRYDRRAGADVLQRAYLAELLVAVNRFFNDRKAIYRQETLENLTGPRLRPVLEYIEAHLTDDLSLDALSQGLSMSKSTISHLFKAETGATPSKYISARRMSLAKHLLRIGASVTEACSNAGFNDYANFIRAFKASAGMSPGQYRQKFSKKSS